MVCSVLLADFEERTIVGNASRKLHHNSSPLCFVYLTAGPGARKLKPKRVSDVNAMGGGSPTPPVGPPGFGGPQMGFNVPSPQPDFNQGQGGFPQQSQAYFPAPGQQQAPVAPNYNQFGYGPQPTQFPQSPQYGQPQQQPQPPQQFGQFGTPQQPPQPGFAPNIFQQPIVQDMALQYGQRLADQGKELVEKNIGKFIPISTLKYYFSVDNRYVLKKLKLLYFPFFHSDWSLKYEQDNAVQPRFDHNAPDLYIPMMAYITYIVLAGLVLGMQDRFSPEQLGIQASSALAYSIIELVIYLVTLYVTNIPTTLKTFDLIALSGYKYAIIVTILLWTAIFKRTGYYVCLIYCSISLGFFLLRTLRAKVLVEPVQTAAAINYGPYGGGQNPQFAAANVARKRKIYFMFLVAGLQPLLAFWLTVHLIPSAKVE